MIIKITRYIFIMIIAAAGLTTAQLYKTSWGAGFGGTYPRFFSITGSAYSANDNYGGFAFLQRNFTEHVTLRLQGQYSHMESIYYDVNSDEQIQKLDQFAGNLDVLYTFVPCEPISPFITFGIGITNFTPDNSFNKDLDDNFWGYQANLGIGVDWRIIEDFSLRTEAVYRTSSNNKIDGNDRINVNDKGLFGGNGDTYMTLDVGLVWYFGQGELSKICDICPPGVTEVIKEVPVTKEVPVEVIKEIRDTVYIEKPFFFGVHFEFNKANLRPESYPILEHALEVLRKYPNIKILISGHTDSLGTNDYNKKLSERRVDAVYNYLISNGIDPGRITKSAYGETEPIRDNSTDINRAFNRRVEFHILEK